MNIVLRIQRFNPETDKAPYFHDYSLETAPSDRILDALLHVKHYMDATLAVRKSCAHGICGSDAMRINGVERLACKTLVKDVAASDGAVITLEPLQSLPIERDLMVDQSVFFEKYKSVKPFLIPAKPAESREYTQTPAERSRFDEATRCILCGACYSSCPVLAGKSPGFIGPAAILSAARFVQDSRDTGISVRTEVLDTPDGVWACENHFECTKVCPRGIKVTKNINETKRAITKFKESDH